MATLKARLADYAAAAANPPLDCAAAGLVGGARLKLRQAEV
jgi:hypothetical protein